MCVCVCVCDSQNKKIESVSITFFTFHQSEHTTPYLPKWQTHRSSLKIVYLFTGYVYIVLLKIRAK